MSNPKSGAAIYRCFDKCDRLLYVGTSSNLAQRLRDHQSTKNWFQWIATIKVEHYPTRKEAVMAEHKAIVREHPEWNWNKPWSDWHPGPLNTKEALKAHVEELEARAAACPHCSQAASQVESEPASQADADTLDAA
jgi:predicted GIY-YIG superfamily endonuclease